jgi:predicted nucleic acid-binding protein
VSVKPFLDTNILVYAFSSDDPRTNIAASLVANGGLVSIQVLNEFVNVSRQKLLRDWGEIEAALDVLNSLLDAPRPLTLEIHRAAINLARDFNYHFYDGLILAAAIQAGCSILYTEDLRHGQIIAGLTICNPFIE